MKTKESAALKFVLMIGILSFFADFTYEGSRSILGPFLAMLGASATAVGVVTGFGELLGYGLRLVSGRMAERTGEFWQITIFGYFVQLLSVPALALTGNWEIAAADHSGAGRQSDPQSAARHDAFARRERDRLRLGFRHARGARPIWRTVRPARRRGCPNVARRISPRLRRASAYGLFTAGYGLF
jgi:hypothetical protein